MDRGKSKSKIKVRKAPVFLFSLFALAVAMFFLGGRRAGAQVDVTVQVAPASADDMLSALTVSAGTLSPAFAPGAFSYADTLPYGTNAVPTVTAATNNPSATDSITQASALPGSATVLVTATDGTTSQTYIVSFTVSSAPVVVSSGGGGGGGSAYDLSINSGAATTPTLDVTLSLYGTEAYTMEVSNISSFASSTWIPYVTSLPWMLAPGAGEETVFVQFRSVSGSIVGSAEASIDLTASSTPAPSSPTSSSSMPAVTPLSTAGMSVSQLESLLSSLEAQLQALRAETSGTVSAFTRNLSFGMQGSDVTHLQRFLISQNAGPAARKLAAHGATTNFGPLTYRALMEFQKAAGIAPASGYFGPITRAYVNSH